MNNLFNDDITKSIASSVRDVLEGKPAVKKEEVKYPHMMYDPKTGKGVEVKDKAEHDKYSKMGWGHDKPKSVSEVEEPNVPSKDANMGSKQGEDEFKKLHKGKKVGEKEDGSVVKEETLSEAYNKSKELARLKKIDKLAEQIGKEIRNFPDEITDEGTDDKDLAQAFYDMNKGLGDLEYGIGDYEYALKNLDESVKEATLAEEVKPEEDEAKLKESEKQEAYKKFFDAALKKFGVDSPADLDDAKKKEFFNYIDKNYKAKAEEIDAKGKSDDEEEVQEAMSAAQMKKRYEMIKKSVEKINKQNLDRAKKDALKMMKDSGMFDESSDDNDDEEEVNEGKIKITAFTGNDPDTMEGESYKKYGLKLKKVGASYGYDDVELSGPDSKIIKFAQRNLGVEGKTVREIQKELDNM